ncbi:hypothetical protein M9Y10_011544 [Tritrichomonas musculus]|uniref:Clan CD, family C14, metacaspase-like cysteine peptidase n=1 Tax=Tritrichomonas musculus TaxID=1915356 RepID=A0ABR2IJN9_9EUKA
MGQEGSVQAPQYTVKDGFECEQFQKQHNANQPELVLQQLSSIGTDLSKISPKVPIPMAIPHPKVLFLICNTYTSSEYKLGSGPLNDSLAVASFLKQIGYTVFFLHNSSKPIFVEWFKHILKNATTELIVFFAGRACAVKEGEANGNNEVMLFDDGYVKDDELSDLLSQCRGPNQKTVLLSDCCHSATIWDLDSFKVRPPQNILTISAAKDSQGTLDTKEQGIFTLYFWKIWSEDPSITVKQMKDKIASPLSKYQIHLDYYTTTPELLDQPIFTKPEENQPKPLISTKTIGSTKTTKPAEPAKQPEPAKPAKVEKPVATERDVSIPATQEATPATQEATPATQKATPATQKATPATQEATPATQEATPATQEATPATQEATPATQEATPTTQEATPTTQEATPAKDEKSSDDEDDKSSSDDEDKKAKKSESSSDDEDKKAKKSESSSDDEDKKAKNSESSSDDEDKKAKKSDSSDDEDDKSDKGSDSSNDEDDKSDDE